MNPQKYWKPLRIRREIELALQEKRSFSLIRLGVMERLLMDLNVCRGQLKPEALMNAVKRAQVIGIDWNAFASHPLPGVMDRWGKPWTLHDINWKLCGMKGKQFLPIMITSTVLFIGRRARELARRAVKMGVKTAGSFELDTPFKLAEALEYARKCPPYTLALLSSDIGTAAILAPEIARYGSCVALDMGLVLDDLLEKGW